MLPGQLPSLAVKVALMLRRKKRSWRASPASMVGLAVEPCPEALRAFINSARGASDNGNVGPSRAAKIKARAIRAQFGNPLPSHSGDRGARPMPRVLARVTPVEQPWPRRRLKARRALFARKRRERRAIKREAGPRRERV